MLRNKKSTDGKGNSEQCKRKISKDSITKERKFVKWV